MARQKKNDWYEVRYVQDGVFHQDMIRGLKEAKKLAEHYNVPVIKL